MKYGKKILRLFLVTAIVVSVLMISALAAETASGYCGPDVKWSLSDDGVLTISGTGAMSDYNEDPAPWYRYRKDITKVMISPGVTEIGNYMFNNCLNLSEVTIPSGVTRIGEDAFNKCSSLREVDLPEGLKRISASAFRDSGLTCVDIPASVTFLGISAFNGCEDLASVTIPATVTGFHDFVFGNCPGLTTAGPMSGEYDIRFGWTAEIPEYAFSCCNSLREVTIPATVKKIGLAAFDGCDGLAAVYYCGSRDAWDTVDINTKNGSNAKLTETVVECEYVEYVKMDTAPSVLASNRASDGKPVLTWKAVDGAVKYQVYRAASRNGTYGLMYTTAGTSYINSTAESGKTYYYKVRAVSGRGDYSPYSAVVCRTCDYAQPVAEGGNRASDGKPTLTWKAVPGATKYEVYRATSYNGPYTWTYSTTGTSYVNTLAESGVCYFYKVRAYGSVEDAASAYSAVVTRTCDYAQPSVSASNRASDGKPTLTWKAVPGATKYEVYRSTSKNGTYSWTYSTTGTSYTNTLAEPGNTYYYKVRAYGSVGAAASAYSTVVTRTCDYAAPVVTASNRASDGKPTLSWTAVPGATKYEVYRSTSRNGAYIHMFSTTGTSYLNTSAESGKTYYYKVRAVGSVSDAVSAFSTVDERTCDYAAPVVTASNRASDGKPALTWKTVPGATNYEVYRSTSKNGTYSWTYSTTGTSYVNTLAESGNTYYYKVRAFGPVGSAASAYSSVVSQTCK